MSKQGKNKQLEIANKKRKKKKMRDQNKFRTLPKVSMAATKLQMSHGTSYVMRASQTKMPSVPFSASASAHQDAAPGKGEVIYPAFYHSESSINWYLHSHSTMTNDGHNYAPNSQQVTKVSSGSQKKMTASERFFES